MTPADQIAAIETFLGHVNRGDFEAASLFIHPAFYLIEQPGLPYAGEWCGREGFLALMAEAGATWGRWRDAPYPYEMTAHGSRVIKEVHFTATAAATGREVDMDFAEVFEFADDLIYKVRAYYWDPEAVRAATTLTAQD